MSGLRLTERGVAVLVALAATGSVGLGFLAPLALPWTGVVL